MAIGRSLLTLPSTILSGTLALPILIVKFHQGPHFNLRTMAAIEDALRAGACLRKEAATAAPTLPINRCPRGRKRRQAAEMLAAA
jgi:hypothetical protein